MSEPPSFGRWLKRLRTEHDLTQEALAEAVGCAPQTLRAIETGVRRPSRALAERIADVLHVPSEAQAEFVRLARAAQLLAPAAGTDAAGEPAARRVDADAPEASGVRGAREQSPILATKLNLPRLRAELVVRPRLLARLDAGLEGPLTLIAAPAGFGKTTLLADWLGRMDRSSCRVGWLALDAGDSDPSQFLRYLIAALQTMAPGVGASIASLLASTQSPPLEVLLPPLINDLLCLPERSILVLDDLHVVDAPSIHQAIAFLVEHIPPQLHLVIATRVDPPLALSRLRARGQLTELRADDLRFTTDEAATFLGEVLGVPLAPEDVAALEGRTEGWIAGLQLAALSLRSRPGERQREFIEAFAGSHHFVVDYLVDEVLAHQPAHLQTFLLQTSILHRLCGPLCDAVVLGTDNKAPSPDHGESKPAASLGRPGSAAGGQSLGASYSQVLLEELERTNLFFVPLDDERRWYRYHHLFAQVLRARLMGGASAEAVATLHGRASRWLEGHGLASEAVRHALAARDWERAAALIEAHGRALLMRGQAHTVLGWLNSFPAPVADSRPALLHLHALALFGMNQLEAAESRLQAVAEMLAGQTLDDRARTALGYATILRGAIARFRGDVASCVSFGRQALDLLPPQDMFGRTSIDLIVAWADLMSGSVAPANERQLLETVASARASGHSWTILTAIVILAGFRRRQGRLREAVATYGEAVRIAPEPAALPTMPDAVSYYFGLGDVLRERNELDAAEDLLAQGRDLVRGMRLAEAERVTHGYIALARLQQARGAGSDALATLHEIEAVARERRFAAYLITRVTAARAHLALMQHEIETAVHWAETSDVRTDEEPSYQREPEHLTLVRVRIAQARSDPAHPCLREALPLLDRLLAAAEAVARMDSLIEILSLRALARQAQGDCSATLADLERALALAAPEGYVRIFVDEGAPMAALLNQARAGGIEPGYVATLLAAYGDGAQGESAVGANGHTLPSSAAPANTASIAPALSSLPEALTLRELEVLRLLAAGHSNQAIAKELIVAVGTVKRHVNSILGKLQAQSRLEAVARARNLQIV